MKVCPACQTTFEDDSLVFCLEDGTRLQATVAQDLNATWHLPHPTVMPAGPTVASPRNTAPPVQPTITARPEQFQAGTPYPVGENRTNSSWKSLLPWIFAIVLVIAVSGVIMAWLLTRGRDTEVASKNPVPTPSSTPAREPSVMQTPEATPEVLSTATPVVRQSPSPPKELEKPKSTPTREEPKPMFAVLNNMTFNGSRITYYPRPSFGQCQADCAGNSNCKGFTWIRPGAYNAGDSAMCYLMSAITARVSHACCISGVRN